MIVKLNISIDESLSRNIIDCGSEFMVMSFEKTSLVRRYLRCYDYGIGTCFQWDVEVTIGSASEMIIWCQGQIDSEINYNSNS